MPVSRAETEVPRVLIVDDVASNLTVLSSALEPLNYEILVASSGAAALKLAERALPDLILLDVMMPDLNGYEICRMLKEREKTASTPVIFLTGRGDVASLVEGFRSGGVDYVVKPFQAEEVITRVSTHVRLSRLTRELAEKNRMLETRTAELTEEIERRRTTETALGKADARLRILSDQEASRWDLTGLIGGGTHIKTVIEEIERLHPFSNTTVLITGESGTGKELVARAIHHTSLRSRGPFIPVNCVAIPAELAESILFGHVRGAFTGAISDRKGCFELAEGGTLFLDEIGDMPLGIQVKLLRVLEDGCVTPVGTSEGRKVDVRVVAATNADLASKIEAGAFRRDLYFRLARYTVSTPPLRDRKGDIPILARHFLKQFSTEMGFTTPTVSEAAMQVLSRHSYPGNVRELKNVVEGALIKSGGGPIGPEHLALIGGGAGVGLGRVVEPEGRQRAVAGLPLNLAEAEDVLIQRALDETGGNIAEAARLLGVHRTRVYRKLAQISPEGEPSSRARE